MAAYLEASNKSFFHKGLDYVIDLADRDLPKYYDKFVEQMTNKSAYYRFATVGDMPPADVVSPGQGINFYDFDTPFQADYTPRKRAMGFSWDLDAEVGDEYGLFAKRAPMMAQSLDVAIELDMAAFLNLGTNAAQVYTPDLQALFSASHPLQAGVASNILSGSNLALSVGSLAQAMQEIMRQRTHIGQPSPFGGPFYLLVAPENWENALRITESERYPGTNFNDPNVAGRPIKGVIVSPFFSSPTAWALIPADKSKNPLKMINKRGLRNRVYEDPDKDIKKATTSRYWARVPMDWRKTIYSPGA